MSKFDHFLQRLFHCIVFTEQVPEETSTTHGGVKNSSVATARRLYSGAESTSWGEDSTADTSTNGWRSFMDGPLVQLPVVPEAEKTPPPNLRKRPAIVGVIGFPTPRGLLVAHGGRL